MLWINSCASNKNSHRSGPEIKPVPFYPTRNPHSLVEAFQVGILSSGKPPKQRAFHVEGLSIERPRSNMKPQVGGFPLRNTVLKKIFFLSFSKKTKIHKKDKSVWYWIWKGPSYTRTSKTHLEKYFMWFILFVAICISVETLLNNADEPPCTQLFSLIKFNRITHCVKGMLSHHHIKFTIMFPDK